MPDPNEIGNNVNNSVVEFIESQGMSDQDVLRSIDLTLKAIARPDGIIISQSSMKDLAQQEQNAYRRDNSRQNRGTANNQQRRGAYNRDDAYSRENSNRRRTGYGKTADDFVNSLEQEFKNALFGSSHPIQDALLGPVQDLAKQLGVDVSELGNELGKQLGNIGAEAFKKTGAGKAVTGLQDLFNKKISDAGGEFINNLGDILSKEGQINPGDIANMGRDVIKNNFGDIFGDMGKVFEQAFSNGGAGEVVDAVAKGGAEILQSGATGTIASAGAEVLATAEAATEATMAVETAASTAAPALASAGAGAAAAGGGLAAVAAAAAPILPIILAVGAALAVIGNIFGPVIEAVGDFIGSLHSAATRAETQAAKNLKHQQERIKSDIQQLVESSFDIIKESAKTALDVWDATLQTVTSSQKYTKADTQDLWQAYASKLREEGLDAVVSSGKIMENLQDILNKGLSGQVAEEFAYIATVLHEAVPTQDFFQYASTYASIAAQAVARGQSQDEAIQYANTQLMDFADNLLNASRNIAGGFTTTLKDGSEIFEESAKIAATNSKISVASISGVLTAISASVGAVAPDLASELVSAIVNAATGGNSSELTAFRSLAGVGASNTAFLQALAQSPAETVANLFSRLGELQTMSSENYMEVAEALAQTFGVSRDTFARVDFATVAAAVKSIAESSASGELEESIALLGQGQTTSSKEQARMQKINEYMFNEGLAYVLDNEVARAVQEHMWQEQLARELEENEYAVDLSGKSLGIIQAIGKTVTNLLTTVVPGLGAIKDALTVATTLQEAAAQQADLLNVLEEGVVGGTASGSAVELYQLTTTGTDLYLAGKYNQAFQAVHNVTKAFDVTKGVSEGLNSLPGLLTMGINSLNTKGSSASNVGATITSANSYLAGVSRDVIKASEVVNGDIRTAAGSAANSITLTSMKIGDVVKMLGKALAETIKNFTAYQKKIGKSYSDSLSKEYKEAYATREWLSDAANASGSSAATKAFSALWKNESVSRTDTYNVDNILKQGLGNLLTKSIGEYVDETTKISQAADNIRKDLSENNDILIQRDKDFYEREGRTSGEYALLHRDFMTQSEMLTAYIDTQEKALKNTTERTFENWVAEFEKSSAFTTNTTLGSNLEALLSNYDITMEEVRAIFENRELAAASASEKARQLHEVQFWEDMQQFATKDFPWYMREWERYYIQHEAYTDATAEAYKKAVDLQVEEKGELGDSVLALAEALIENNNWQESLGDKLKDPVVHTNVLLSKILLTTEAIMQQNNETSIVSVPTALSSLGLGVSNY